MATAATRRRIDSSSSYGSRTGRNSKSRIIDSDEESIDEKISDNDLLVDFNAISKPKKSYLKSARVKDKNEDDVSDDYLRGKDDKMLMTLKKPWQPSKRSTSPRASPRTRHLDSVDYGRDKYQGIVDNSLEDEEASYRQRHRSTERSSVADSRDRSKSPALNSPRSLRASLESVEYEGRRTPIEQPRPAARQRKVIVEKQRSDDEDSDDGVVIRRDNRQTGRGSVTDDMAILSHRSESSPPENGHSRRISDGNKSPKTGSGRSSPEERRRNSKSGSGRNTPETIRENHGISGKNSGMNTPVRNLDEERKSPKPFESANTASSRLSDRSSPRERRRTTQDSDRRPASRDSIVEQMTAVNDNLNNRHDSESDEENHLSSRQSGKRNRNRRASGESVKREGEMSGFVEMIAEPIKNAEKPKNENESKSDEKKKSEAEKVITERQRVVNETIELVSSAQNASVTGTVQRETIKKPPHQKGNLSSTTNKGGETKPQVRSRYAVVRPPSARDLSRRNSTDGRSNFDSTTDIRNAIFDEWSREAAKRKKQQQLEEKRRQEEDQMKERNKNRNDEDRAQVAQASYNSWKERKKEFIKKMAKKKKEEEEKKRMKEEEQREKKKEAEMSFLKWKERKDSVLQETYKKKLQEEKDKVQQKKAEERGKQLESESAYGKWMEEKEREKRALQREARREEMRRKQMEMAEQNDRKAEARRLYVEWLKQKEEQQEEERRRKLYEADDQQTKRPWRPSSHTVQFGLA